MLTRHWSESFWIHLKYLFLPTAFRTEVRFGGNHLVVEQLLRHLRNAVSALWLKQIVRHRGVEIWSGEIHAFLVEHHHVALHIVGADGHVAFVERLHRVDHHTESVHRQIGALMGFGADGEAEDIGGHRLVAHRHDMHSHALLVEQRLHIGGGLVEVGN